MYRIPADDEYRGIVEGLCLGCQAVTAEWRTEDGDWWECDDCADVDGEDALNEAKRQLNRVRAGLRRDDMTPMARMVLTRAGSRLEGVVSEFRKRYVEEGADDEPHS